MTLESDINLGALTEALNNKMDLPTGASQQDCRVVVETYQNGTDWYRVYSDGWCEQGGRANGSTSDVPFLQAFKDTNYNLQIRYDYNNSGTMGGVYWYAVKTTTKFTTGAHSTNLPFDWVAEGYIR